MFGTEWMIMGCAVILDDPGSRGGIEFCVCTDGAITFFAWHLRWLATLMGSRGTCVIASEWLANLTSFARFDPFKSM